MESTLDRIRWFVTDEWPILLIIGAVVGLITLMVFAQIADEREWKAFSATHACKVVATMDGSTGVGTGVTSGGNVATVTTYTPGKTGYLCDDGVTHWREN